jgi:hypothetical protein
MCGDGCGSTRIIAIRQSEAERERRRRVEAGIHRAQLLETTDDETGRHEEHECERDLTTHQQVTNSMAPATGRAAAPALVQRRGERGAAPQRNRTKYQRSQRTQRQRVRNGDAVQVDFGEARQVGRTDRHEQTHGAPRESQSDGTARYREEDALCEEVARDAEAARPEGDTDCDFALARLRAHQKEVRDVRARDQ